MSTLPSIESLQNALSELRERILANVVMAGEIPSPTGEETALARYVEDRFREANLDRIGGDEVGNIAGILPGEKGDRQILVAAHLDKIWPVNDEHTVAVGVRKMTGRGLADNSLGVAILASLPMILEATGIKLNADLVLVGTSQSFGRGDLRGMRFFLAHCPEKPEAAVCLEGIQLGRLSYQSLGMSRVEVIFSRKHQGELQGAATLGVTPFLAALIRQIEAIADRERDHLTLLLGSVEAGASYSEPPRTGSLRFEVRGVDRDRIAAVEAELVSYIRSLEQSREVSATIESIATREVGSLEEKHPLVVASKKAMQALGIETRLEPSISELSALLDAGVPAVTLGLGRGENRHTPEESIFLEEITDGIVQLLLVLQEADLETKGVER
ncbi:MAG: M20/M25/M40 family metallo-hydrolase [Verrucomicrobiota bacterium]